MIKQEKKEFNKGKEYKGKGYRGKSKNYRPLKCPYCNEKEKEYLEVRGNQVSCLTCGNDSDKN